MQKLEPKKEMSESEVEMLEIKKQIKNLDLCIFELKKDHEKTRGRLLNSLSRLDAFEPQEAERLTKLIEVDLRHLHSRLQVEITKVTVATEVGRWLKEDPVRFNRSLLSLISYFDESDQWWEDRQDMTIGQWALALTEPNRLAG